MSVHEIGTERRYKIFTRSYRAWDKERGALVLRDKSSVSEPWLGMTFEIGAAARHCDSFRQGGAEYGNPLDWWYAPV